MLASAVFAVTPGAATSELGGTPDGFEVATTAPVGAMVIGLLDPAALMGADATGWLGSVALALLLGEITTDGPKIMPVVAGGGD